VSTEEDNDDEEEDEFDSFAAFSALAHSRRLRNSSIFFAARRSLHEQI